MNKTEPTQEQKQIKIAEACGWKWESRIRGAIKVWNKPPLMLFHDNELPDYFNDLNAMHEAEKTGITSDNSEDYDFCLREAMQDANDYIWSATAAQRAEAFGKTLGLW